MERLFFKGFTFGWMAKRGGYLKESTLDSLRKLKETGSEWVAIAFDTRQETVFSTKIGFDYGYNVTDREVKYLVDKAHELGLKVCLKPVVNCNDNVWRGQINFTDDTDLYWDAWFESYKNFICHYAELAEEVKCEMFCAGCEYIGTERKEKHWRRVIGEIRKIYSGPVIYNANHGSEHLIEWFDSVDVIGTSAYYPVADGPGASEEEMVLRWQTIKPNLQKLYEKYKKPIVFIEIGCRSAAGCATMPWDFTHTDLPFDEQEQANFYSSVMKVFWEEEWFGGFFWWDWSHDLYPAGEAKKNKDFGIYGKEAEKVLKEWYFNK